MRLDGETAFITGSTSGIGKKIAEFLLSQGASVTICSRTQEQVDNTVKDFRSSFGEKKVIGFTCDVSDYSSLENAVDETVKIFGSLRIMVANAGINQFYGPFDLLTPEQIASSITNVLGVNLIGTINSISAVLPIMKQQNYGRIITLSGAGGDSKRPQENMTIYSASKGGIVSFSICLAEELKNRHPNIKINVYQPGMIKTNLGKDSHLVSNWIDEATFKRRVDLAHEYIGTNINESVPKILPFVLPNCKENGTIFHGFSLRKLIPGAIKLRRNM